ncbi:hypothetical protein DFH27DRAFT_608410 [Peziza echinospora]|nr:hypothetical protein DFH27DRAFT_608410 [Peziza echinospora]
MATEKVVERQASNERPNGWCLGFYCGAFGRNSYAKALGIEAVLSPEGCGCLRVGEAKNTNKRGWGVVGGVSGGGGVVEWVVDGGGGRGEGSQTQAAATRRMERRSLPFAANLISLSPKEARPCHGQRLCAELRSPRTLWNAAYAAQQPADRRTVWHGPCPVALRRAYLWGRAAAALLPAHAPAAASGCPRSFSSRPSIEHPERRDRGRSGVAGGGKNKYDAAGEVWWQTRPPMEGIVPGSKCGGFTGAIANPATAPSNRRAQTPLNHEMRLTEDRLVAWSADGHAKGIKGS